MTIVSHERKVLMLHIQKCGGITLRKLLRAKLPGAQDWLYRHTWARHVRPRLENWDDYYRFAFVRNPWDRLVSWYSMVTQAPRKWKRFYRTKLNLGRAPSFKEFIRNASGILVRPQMDYLCGRQGRLLVNDVYRFEQFDEEVARLGRRLGIDFGLVQKHNASIHAHYSTYYTDELRQMVAERFERDIREFGYAFVES